MQKYTLFICFIQVSTHDIYIMRLLESKYNINLSLVCVEIKLLFGSLY